MLQHVQPAHARHGNVEEDQVRVTVNNSPQSVFPVCSRIDVESARLEAHGDQAIDTRVIIDDKGSARRDRFIQRGPVLSHCRGPWSLQRCAQGYRRRGRQDRAG